MIEEYLPQYLKGYLLLLFITKSIPWTHPLSSPFWVTPQIQSQTLYTNQNFNSHSVAEKEKRLHSYNKRHSRTWSDEYLSLKCWLQNRKHLSQTLTTSLIFHLQSELIVIFDLDMNFLWLSHKNANISLWLCHVVAIYWVLNSSLTLDQKQSYFYFYSHLVLGYNS